MATVNTNLSEHNLNSIPNSDSFKISIVVSEWNSNITDNLFKGAFDTLIIYMQKR